MERDRAPILGYFDRAGEEAVEAERLVGRAPEQALVDVFTHTVGRNADDVERVQAVESADLAKLEQSALGRVRVSVGQVPEVWRERRAAVHGDAVRGLGGVRWQCRKHSRNQKNEKRHDCHPKARPRDPSGTTRERRDGVPAARHAPKRYPTRPRSHGSRGRAPG